MLSGCSPHTYASGQCSNTLDGWRRPGAIGHQVPAHFVTVGADGILRQRRWRGYRMDHVEVLDRKGLSELLDNASIMDPSPMVILNAEPSAKCDLVRAVRAEMEAKLRCKSGQCGEGAGWYELPGMPVLD